MKSTKLDFGDQLVRRPVARSWRTWRRPATGRRFLNVAQATVAAVCLAVLSGCGSAASYTAPPADSYERAVIEGYDRIRFWADEAPAQSDDLLRRRAATMKRRFASSIAAGDQISLNYLALSGGGADGAFGAGLLNGWTEHGSRPEFEVVTGISTGALIAPFAFLGPEWDQELMRVYTTIRTRNLLLPKILEGLTGGIAMTDAAPFRRTIKKFATAEMLAQIADEYRKGRQLFIGTTALDSGRPVTWNIGAIANSGDPGALELFHDILQASASIPGVFPPILIDVEIDGQRYSELHVDGGVTSQVFSYPAQFDARKLDTFLPIKIDRTMYVVRNTTLRPPYGGFRPRLFDLLGRSISVLIASQGMGDIYRIAANAERDGMAFYLASIPESWDKVPDEPFDTNYMNALFDLGERLGREGYAWKSSP